VTAGAAARDDQTHVRERDLSADARRARPARGAVASASAISASPAAGSIQTFFRPWFLKLNQ